MSGADLRVTVIGEGAVGGAVASILQRDPVCREVAVLNSRSTGHEREAAFSGADVVIEASTVSAAADLVPRALASGTDTVLCSCGVLASESFTARCAELPGRLLIPAGAIGGFDVLAAASNASGGAAKVRHTTVKRPAAFGLPDEVTSVTEVFRGSAREAARRFPRTANSSIALAMATVGLDALEVVVRADPAAVRTRHEIEFDSDVGHYSMVFDNAVDPASGGRTSKITAWAAVEMVRAVARGAGPGMVVL